VPVTSVDATRTPANTIASGPTQTSSKSTTAAKSAAAQDSNSLSTFIGKVRELAAQARPARQDILTIEATDGRLREALAVELVLPTPEHMRAVAVEYRRLGIFDKAHAHLARALTAAPDDAVTLDAIARLWRDAGFPGLGLADAHRAVFFAPTSPEARNTLGTILQALGHRRLAQEEYQRAVAINPTAAYALNNLCYASLLDGDASKASALCRRALEVEPTLAAAHNNLALVYEAQGDHAAAGREFASGSDDAGALYNSGIVHLARREYGSAVKAFEAAHALKPTLTDAVARVRQAASAAAAAEE
jgi:Flp pilus assembly protein TadD